MKVLKGFFLVIIVFIMFFMLLMLQLQFALQKTVLSSDYLEKMYDKYDMEDELAELMEKQMEDAAKNFAPEIEGQEIKVNIDPGKYIDTDWLSEVAGDIFMETYGYFMGEEDLPTIDLEPVKEMILDMASDQILEYGNVSEVLKSLDFIIETYNAITGGIKAELDEEAVAALAQKQEAMGIPTEMLSIIISASINMEEGLAPNERAKLIAEEIVSRQMGLDEMSDELDLGEVMQEAYPRGQNPLEAVRTIIGAVKNTLFYALMIIFLLFVLVVVFTAFRPASIFGWLSAPLIMSGLFGVGTGILARLLPIMSGVTEAFGSEAFAGAENVMAFAQGYTAGIFNFALIQGIILLAVGIIFAILAGVISGAARKNTIEEPRANAGFMAVRVIVVVVLLASVVFVGAKYYLKMYDDIEGAVDVLNNAQTSENLAEVISESIDFPLKDFIDGDE